MNFRTDSTLIELKLLLPSFRSRLWGISTGFWVEAT